MPHLTIQMHCWVITPVNTRNTYIPCLLLRRRKDYYHCKVKTVNYIANCKLQLISTPEYDCVVARVALKDNITTYLRVQNTYSHVDIVCLRVK